MNSTGSDSHFREMLKAHLRKALADQAELEIHSESPGLPVQPALDRDDDGYSEQSKANPLWDPSSVDRRINELFNSRWTRPWRRSGEETARR